MEHKHSDDESTQQLAKTVADIREAEERKDRTITAAREKAEGKLKEGKEKAIELGVKAKEETVELKNRLLLEGRKEVGKEISKVTDKAESEAKKLKSEVITTQQADKIAKKSLGI